MVHDARSYVCGHHVAHCAFACRRTPSIVLNGSDTLAAAAGGGGRGPGGGGAGGGGGGEGKGA